MSQMTQMPRIDNAQAWPYRIDPRTYGVGQTRYEQILAEHRRREHMHIMQEQQDAHDKAMEYNAAVMERRMVWVRPATALCKSVGGVLWFLLVMYGALWLGSTIGETWRERTARWCLEDVAACQKMAGDFKSVR